MILKLFLSFYYYNTYTDIGVTRKINYKFYSRTTPFTYPLTPEAFLFASVFIFAVRILARRAASIIHREFDVYSPDIVPL